VFYVVRVVRTFDFRLVIHETPNKWRPVERSSSAWLMFFTGSLRFQPTVVASVNGLYRSCAGQLHSLAYGTLKTVSTAGDMGIF
jgi:hypothetical protein